MHESPHARKVRLLAAELDIPLDIASAAIRAREKPARPTTSPRIPNGKVPTLDEDGFVLWESPAILKYLAAKRPERALGRHRCQEQALGSISGCSGGAAGPEAAIDALAWELLIKPKVLNQPGNDPGIIADAHTRHQSLPAGARQAA